MNKIVMFNRCYGGGGWFAEPGGGAGILPVRGAAKPRLYTYAGKERSFIDL
jgi:hypothetical protein